MSLVSMETFEVEQQTFVVVFGRGLFEYVEVWAWRRQRPKAMVN